jgi:hypothetical protein
MILTPDAPRLAARNARRSANNRALRPNREAVAQSIIELLNARVGLTTESGGNGDGVPDCHTQ